MIVKNSLSNLLVPEKGETVVLTYLEGTLLIQF